MGDATFYKWRSKYGGMEVSDAKKLKALEAENAKLKKLLAEQMMDVSALKKMRKKLLKMWPFPPLVRGQWTHDRDVMLRPGP